MESTERSEPMSPYDRVKEIDIEKESGRLSSDVTLDGEGETQAAPVDDREAGPDGGQIQPAVSKFSVNNVSSIPNGGLRAWLQVAGTFFLFFNTWGILNTFGAYQTYYETGELFHASSSTISWIGSVQAFLVLLVGTLSGPIYDAGYVYSLLWVGSIVVVFGQMMLSLCHEYYQALLAQAFVIGIGAGCLFIPGVAILSTYFNSKIAFAVGIAASGSSLGGVIYPIVFHQLQTSIGFAWTTRVLGFMMLATLAVPLAVMKVRVLPAQKRKLVDWSAFTEAPYVFFVTGAAITFMGLYTPFFFIQYYSIQEHITDTNLGFYLLAILNTASIAGRILPNFIADKVGPFNVIVPCAAISGVLIFGLIGTHSVASIIVICILYGFFSGSFVSLPPTCFVSLSPNRGLIGTRMGMGFAIISIGGLTGTPIGGAILNSHGWVATWAYGGATAFAGAILMLMSRMYKADWKLVTKV